MSIHIYTSDHRSISISGTWISLSLSSTQSGSSIGMDYRGSRTALFDGIEEGGIRASSPYTSHEIDEHDNDRAMDGLQDRVIMLKRLTGDIHEEVENHNRVLTAWAMIWTRRGGVLSGTMDKFKMVFESKSSVYKLRGHFVGHYMSVSAQMWVSTHNDSLKDKMSAVVSALSACQDKLGSGYLSAFPSELFDRFEAIQPVWAPYYTIHKIMAGLLDQHLYDSNPQALKMLTWMVDYFYDRVQNVIVKYSVEKHCLSLNEETGGMNDVLYKLYTVTVDDISGFHANNHIPVVIGVQMRYEVTGDRTR